MLFMILTEGNSVQFLGFYISKALKNSLKSIIMNDNIFVLIPMEHIMFKGI